MYGQKFDLVSVSGHRNWLDYRVEMRFDLTSVLRSKWSWFLCGWSWMPDFSVKDQNWLGFSVEIGTDLVYVWVAKLTTFLYAGLKWLGFSVRIKTDLDFVCVVEIDMISVWGDRTWLYFSVGLRVDLVFVCGIEITFVLEWGLEATCFLCRASKLTLFLYGGRKWLGLRVWIEID